MDFRFLYKVPVVVDTCHMSRIACVTVEWRDQATSIMGVESESEAEKIAKDLTDLDTFTTSGGEVLKRRPVELVKVVKNW